MGEMGDRGRNEVSRKRLSIARLLLIVVLSKSEWLKLLECAYRFQLAESGLFKGYL